MPDILSFATVNGKYLFAGGKMLQIPSPGFLLSFVGYVLSDQGEQISERGFIYGSSAESLNNSIISTDTTPSLFRATVGPVVSGTYFYKAYAINSLGTSYGELKSIIAS